MKRAAPMIELNALLAARDWLNVEAGTRFAELQSGARSAHLAEEYKVSRLQLDFAIRVIREGLAYPSQAFLDARRMAERAQGSPLTPDQLRSLVSAIKAGNDE